MEDTLEYWRDLVLRQSEQINENAETIRRLLAEKQSMDPVRACRTHGKDFAALSTECHTLREAADRADRARGMLAVTINNNLIFPSAERIGKLTADQLHTWTKGTLENTGRVYRGEPELEPAGRIGPRLPPFTEAQHAEGWVDPRDTVEYWKNLAPRQVETLAKQEQQIPKYQQERDAEVARNSRCDIHESYLADLREYVERTRADLERHNKAYKILADWFAALLIAAEKGVPADLQKQAKRVNNRAHRVFSPPPKKRR